MPRLVLLVTVLLANGAVAGGPAPALSLPGLDGRVHRLDDFTGKITLVHFWASWCSPCLKELPQLLATAREYESLGLRLVLIAADNANAVRALMNEQGLRHAVLIDQYGKALRSYRVKGLPSTSIVNRDGAIIATEPGAVDWRGRSMAERLQDLLSE